MLGLAAQVGALVLEIERARTQVARTTETGRRIKGDRAARLIGATPAMEQLRATIERVAATDFTLLLEGGSGAELGIRLRRRFAPSRQDGQMEGAGKETQGRGVFGDQ